MLKIKYDVIFPAEFTERYQILNLETNAYLYNFLSYLMASQVKDDVYQKLLRDMLLLINPKMQCLVELYTVFKKYEQFIEKVYELFQKSSF